MITTIECVDCGDPYDAKRKDATRCPPCRLLSMLTYAAKRFKGVWTCKACGGKFRPAGKAGRLCGTCDVAAKTAELVDCRVCKTHAPAYERVPVCLPCVKDPKAQVEVVKALKRGQASRRAKRDSAAAPA